MDAILNAFFADPLQYIGLVFSFIAGIGAILFIVGFFAGIPHMFTQSANEEHQEHHRLRITWGTMILFTTFIIWELVKIAATFFGYQSSANTSVFGTFILVLVIILVVLWVMFKIKNRVVDSGH